MTIIQWHPLDTARTTTEAKPPTAAQVARRRQYALALCQNAMNATSWRMADRLAKAWECEGCTALGVAMPNEGTVQHGKA